MLSGWTPLVPRAYRQPRCGVGVQWASPSHLGVVANHLGSPVAMVKQTSACSTAVVTRPWRVRTWRYSQGTWLRWLRAAVRSPKATRHHVHSSSTGSVSGYVQNAAAAVLHARHPPEARLVDQERDRRRRHGEHGMILWVRLGRLMRARGPFPRRHSTAERVVCVVRV